MMDSMSPRSRIVIPQRTLLKIRARWLEWSPALKLERQARPSHLCLDETWHRDWLLDLLRQKITMREVRRSEFDDPRQPLTELRRRVTMYLDKRGRRITNVTG